jgi:23S rRNA pseudouridine1911/1915/1917 synthase
VADPDGTQLHETVPAALDGERLDRVVAMLTGRPRSDVDRFVAEGRVAVGGRVATKTGRKLRKGEVLSVDVPAPEADPATTADDSVTVPVVYEDEHLVVVDKPADMVVHPGAGHRRSTMVQGLLSRYPDMAALATGASAERPGIVHRLDRGTSGLLVVARTASARDALVAQLSSRTVVRRYLALLSGTVDSDEGVIDAPLGRAQRDPTRIVVRLDGKEARTRYVVQRRFELPTPATLVEARLETGRTHQIRVHVAAIGHPVIGDERYGGPAHAGLGTGRPWLHAAQLSFVHPATGDTMSFTSDLPPELEGILAEWSEEVAESAVPRPGGAAPAPGGARRGPPGP